MFSTSFLLLAAPGKTLPVLFKAGENFCIVGVARRRAGQHYDIHRRQRRGSRAKTLSHQSFEPVAGHCPAHPALGNCQTQARLVALIVTEQHRETVIGRAAAIAKDALEFGRRRQPLAAAERPVARISIQGREPRLGSRPVIAGAQSHRRTLSP